MATTPYYCKGHYEGEKWVCPCAEPEPCGGELSTKKEKSMEITREMIDVGLQVLDESGRLSTSYLCGSDALLIERIFLAMWACRRA